MWDESELHAATRPNIVAEGNALIVIHKFDPRELASRVKEFGQLEAAFVSSVSDPLPTCPAGEGVAPPHLIHLPVKPARGLGQCDVRRRLAAQTRFTCRASRQGSDLCTTTPATPSVRLKNIIASLKPGDQVVITENQRPVAKLVGEAGRRKPRMPGNCKGMITLLVEDDEHLKDFEDYMP